VEAAGGGVSCSKSRPKINVPILPECRRVLKLASLDSTGLLSPGE
jgi:hypothetical protein